MIGCIRLRAGTVAVSARPGWRATAAEPWQLAAGAWRAAAVRATLCGGARANHGGPLGQRLVHTNLRVSGAAAVTTSPGAHVDAAAVRGDDGWAGAGARPASSMAGSVSTQLPDGGPGSGRGAPATGASAADDRHPELRGHVDASEVLPYASHPPPEPEDAEAEFPFGVRNKPTGLKYFKHRGTWAAQITVDGEYIHLGESRTHTHRRTCCAAARAALASTPPRPRVTGRHLRRWSGGRRSAGDRGTTVCRRKDGR